MDKHDKSAAKMGQDNHSKTPYNTAISLHFDQFNEQPNLNNVNCVKNAILESNFEQLYRICTENLQLIDNQLCFYSASANRRHLRPNALL